MDDADLLAVLHRATDAVVEALDVHDDWGPSGRRQGQYVSDLAADRAAIEVLEDAGLRVLSEESGLGAGDGPVAVLDPLDGSTNASRAAFAFFPGRVISRPITAGSKNPSYTVQAT